MKHQIVTFLGCNVLPIVRRFFFGIKRRIFIAIKGVDFGIDCQIKPGLRVTFMAAVKVGSNCNFERNISIEVARKNEALNGGLSIGDRVWISQGCLFQCAGKLEVGNDVLIGEYTSIRDSSHLHGEVEKPIASQGSYVGSIIIKDNVWIGRGCLIQGKPEGITLGEGCIIGANSVVTKSVPSNTIWGGVPARLIKYRTADDIVDGRGG